MNKPFARRLALAVTACFSWSLVLATSARAITARPPSPPSRTRPLSASEMQHIVGAQSDNETSAPVAPAPFPPNPVFGGSKGGSTNTVSPVSGDPGGGMNESDAGAAPGPSYPWEGTVGDVKTDTGNKMTSIPLVGWTTLGGLPLSVSLIHNSKGDPNRYMHVGPKWAMSYDSWLHTPDNGNTVTVSWADGRAYSFSKNVNGTYSSVAGVYDTLTKPSTTEFDILTKDQIRYRFVFIGNTYFLASVNDENGNTITISRDGSAHVKTIIDANNRTITLGYDASNRLSTVTDPLTRRWVINYDSNGDLGQIDYPALNGTVHSRYFAYNYPDHNIAQMTQMDNLRHSYYSYNSDGSIQWEQDPMGNRTTFSYGVDQNGPNALATTITDPNGFKTTHLYDKNGLLSVVTDALGYTQQMLVYDANNNATKVQDKRALPGLYWYYNFDGMGNMLTSISPLNYTTTLKYNAHNKPKYIKAQDGEQVVLTYDGNDNLTEVQNEDSSNNVKAMTLFDVSSSTYGLVMHKTDANNHVTTYGYDSYGDLTDVTTPTPLSHHTHWSYNALGVATSRTAPPINPSGTTVTATYGLDDWLRTTSITYSSGQYSGNDGNKTYTYDNDGNLTGFANSVGSYTRSYDDDQRMLEEDKGTVRQVSHTYDATGQLGLLSTTTDADSTVTSYGYTHRDELATVNEFSHTTNYAYDPDGREFTINDPLGNFAAKNYDNDGRLSSLINKDPYGNYLSGYGYGYNGDNQKTSCSEIGYNNVGYANVGWGYDALGHLTSETRSGGSARTATYVVDGVGNRTSQTINGTSTTFSYDNDDELTGDSQGGVYQYDGSGNMLGRRRGGNWIYPYSTNENQIAVIYTGAQLPAYSYGYDALGRQAYRTASPSGGANSNDGVRTDYQYDGETVLTEKQGSNTTSRYLLGSSRLAKYGEAPQLDGLGSMRQGLNMSSGVFTGQADYSAFGEVIGGNNTGAFQSVYQWQAQSGYRTDGASGGGGDCGLVKVGARYYDPAVGRFTSRDSDLNEKPYAYCDGDPVNCTDPSGHHRRHHKPNPPKKNPPDSSSQASGGNSGGGNGGGGGNSGGPGGSGGDNNSGNRGTINDTHVTVNIYMGGGNIIKELAEGLEALKNAFIKQIPTGGPIVDPIE